ncbi:MAG: leucyl aminopeptidase family protein [Myxococcota bacterium]
MPAQFMVTTRPSDLDGVDSLLIVGRDERLGQEDVVKLVPAAVGEAVYRQMVRKTDAGDTGRLATTWTAGSPSRLHVGVLPEPCSRHNAPSRAWAIPGLVSGAIHKGNVGIALCLDAPEHAASSVLAVARALPTFVATSQSVDREARILLLPRGGGAPEPARLLVAADAVRRAAHETDEPPDVLGCDEMVRRAQAVATELGVGCTVIRGDNLREHGLGGLYAVGKAANEAPALVVLDYNPPGAKRTVGWVGKGIVYDTGGLSIKAKTSMPGMKTDMAGSAAVLAAFRAAVRLGFEHRLIAALCIAENAVGPGALRPDDVITMYSGRTVEVNNTDAEGRLVLSDGIAWVARNRSPDVLIDLATLTGAQSVATGKRHAAVICNDDALEAAAIAAGKHSGDLVHPLPYLPELLRAEFRSPVADMRNSVKDRSNAQPSCAAQFIANHLQAVGYERPWLHVDLAAPAVSGGSRGTGFGVGLLLALEGLL